jgi:hypothetical protein
VKWQPESGLPIDQNVNSLGKATSGGLNRYAIVR